MKTTTLILSIMLAAFFISSCDKAEDVNEDLTTSIVGHYTNAADATDIVVNKVDNSTISITLSTGTGSGAYSVGFPTATMNSGTSFTMDTVTQEGAVCIGTETFYGTGTHSENNISLFLTEIGEQTEDPPSIYDCSGTRTETISASK